MMCMQELNCDKVQEYPKFSTSRCTKKQRQQLKNRAKEQQQQKAHENLT